MKAEDEKLLTPLEAAHHFGITTELLFQFTKRTFGRSAGLRALETVEHKGQTRFSLSELNAFDSLLGGPWSNSSEDRPAIPKAILDHLRAESRNQCARCGSGIGVDTAHIRPWKDSRSHHPNNLIRICSACHREHDFQNSLSAEELQALKDRLIAGTRANLKERMQPLHKHLRPPRPLRDFVGRESELETLVEALRSGRSAAIFGVAGIGKSELVLQALDCCETGRPVLWCNIEQYRKVADVTSALQTALSIEGIECSDQQLSSRLDAIHACVVFDGIEQSGLDNLDEFEDTVDTLFRSTSDTQFVSTSQVLLHRLPAEARLKLGGLEEAASRTLLVQSCNGDDDSTYAHEEGLLDFCDGHALTIRLAGALTVHYGGTAAALDAICNRGVESVGLPGRKRHSRRTNLELCLQTAYEALSPGSRQVLWALAEAPAGVWTHYIAYEWLELDGIADALASLRKWHLVDVAHIDNNLSRTRILNPVRRFVTDRGRQEDLRLYEETVRRTIQGFAMMVAVLELNYDTPEDTPYALQRFDHELPNLLHVLEVAQERIEDEELVLTALSVVQSLMRFFFVLRLPEQGAHVLYDATDLAVRTGHFERASGLAMQFLTLAQRTGDESLIAKVQRIVDQIASSTTDLEVLSDVAMCRALAAQSRKDFPEAERQARQAFEGYRTVGRALKGKTEADDDLEAKRQGLHNDISNALGMLGFALLSQEKYGEAAQAYRHSLQHQRGASIGVNRGQTLHQIGNAYSTASGHPFHQHPDTHS
uniref:HNH endonuclease n=1 Tax=uncultured Rhodospira sp. TaxID=1936189 RepID=UPI00260CA4CF